MAEPVSRFDAAKVTGFHKDSRGFLRSKANISRVGVLDYRLPDGSIVREFRSHEEVAKADSLASLEGAALTDLHPSEPVTPENARELGRGHVASPVRMDGDYVTAEVVVEDAGLIAAIEKGERSELSAGYSCVLVEEPGIFQGQRYDRRQTQIVYNHAALGPRGWGRAGPRVALRADSQDAIQVNEDVPVVPSGADPSDNTNPAPAPNQVREDSMTVKYRIDSGVAEVSEETLPIVEKAIKDRDDSIKSLTEAKAEAQAKTEAETKRADSLEAERDALKAKLDAAEKLDAERLDAAVKARLSLERGAAKVLGADEKLDGLSDDEIKAKVLEKARPELKLDSKSPEYVACAFDLAVADAEKRTDSLKKNRATTTVAATETTRDDADDVDPYAARKSAYQAFRKESN